MRVVERATEDDLAEVIAVDAAHHSPARSTYLEAAIINRACYIARDGWDVLGFIVLTRSFFDHYFIELLIVHPQRRRTGVAAALIQHVEKICPDDKLFTSTNESNMPMRSLCEKLGYVKSGWIDNLDDGDPEIIYFKRIERS